MPNRGRIRGRSTAAALTFTLAAVAGCALVVGGDQAMASHVGCGDTITADTTLDSDLVDCPSNGIVIGRDGIELDLNGHRIDGDGAEFEDCPRKENCDVGILVDRHKGVTVKDGRMRAFAFGVLVLRARDVSVREVSSSRNDLFGGLVAASKRIVLRASSWSHNVAPEGDGIGVFGSERVRIVRNSIRGNPGPGIHVADSAHASIQRNRMTRNSPSILMEAGASLMRGNRIVGGGGILLGPGADENVVVGNRVVRASDSLAVENGSGNLVARNVVVESRADGIRLGIGQPPFGGDHNVVRRNVVKRSGEDGFHVYAKDDHSLLRRNVAIGSADDGFEVQNRTTRLAGNRAVRNADLGIRAVPGVIDGGHNVAAHNGDRRQCTNIACG